MFYGAAAFNQPIGNWDVSSLTNMRSMFMNAYNFNQDISNWDVSNVENMNQMFSGSLTFPNSFGGATRLYDTGQTTYFMEELGESWGGFAIDAKELNLPLKFTNDGTITFNAYINPIYTTTTEANIKFRLEKDPYVSSSEDPKQTTDFYETPEITIIPSQISYSITIPSQGTQEFNNVMLYVVTRDVPVTINAVNINNDTPSNKMSFDQNINIWKVNQYKSDGTTPTELTYMFDNMPIKTGNPYGFSVPTPTFDEFNQNIGIKGSNPVIIERGSIYTDAGAVAASDITNFTTTSNVNTSIAGRYSVIYSGTKNNHGDHGDDDHGDHGDHGDDGDDGDHGDSETVTATRTVFVGEVCTFGTKIELQNAINKWYEIAAFSLDEANNYIGVEYFGNPSTWDVTLITDMSFLFIGRVGNNHPEIGTWNTCFVTTMESMFEESSFNKNIGGWNVHNVNNFKAMFKNNIHFDNAGSDSIDEWTTYWTHKKRC